MKRIAIVILAALLSLSLVAYVAPAAGTGAPIVTTR